MWRLRNTPYVYVSLNHNLVLLGSVYGLRYEMEDPTKSDDHIKGYCKGAESALFDCGFPDEFVFKNTDILKDIRHRVVTDGLNRILRRCVHEL